MPDGGEISVNLNGERRTVSAGIALPSLIESLGLPVQGVLVEYNGIALLRAEWASVRLVEGDRLEILRIVAGG